MDQLTNKQRQIIRLAYQSKDPELRRRAVEQVVTARYTQEFKNWANDQGSVFTRRETGNKVRFNSLDSSDQKEVYRRWRAGEYQDRGGPAPGEHEEGDDAQEGAQEGEGGGRHADRTELRGKPKKQMSDDSGLKDDDLERILPMEKINQLEGNLPDKIKDGFKNTSFQELETLRQAVEYMAANPDEEYTKNHWLTKVAKVTNDEMKKLHKGLSKKLEKAKGRKYSDRVLQVANDNNLEGVDADAVWQFRKDKPSRGRKLSAEELKAKFLAGSWADQETKERVREMSADEFMAMRNAIFDEEDEDLEFAEAEAEAQAGRQASEKDDLRLFEKPPGSEENEKEARLSSVGRKIVRMAFHSTDPDVRRKLVRRAKAELNA